MPSNLILNALLLAAVLFGLGLAGLLARRNVIFTLMSIEVMLNAAGVGICCRGSALGTSGRTGDVSVYPRHGRRGGLGGTRARAAPLPSLQVARRRCERAC